MSRQDKRVFVALAASVAAPVIDPRTLTMIVLKDAYTNPDYRGIRADVARPVRDLSLEVIA